MTNNPATWFAPFAGRARDQVRKLIAGPTVYICDNCAILCLEIISRESWNLRAAYFSFGFVAKLLDPIARVFWSKKSD